MKKQFLLLFIVATTGSLFAQNTTTGSDAPVVEQANKKNVLVIPFEAKMYISDIDRDLATKNSLNFQEIKGKFRAALDRNLFIALKPYYSPLSFYAIEPQEAKKEMAYIYNSIGYKYDVIPQEEVVEKQNVGKKFLKKFKKKDKEEEHIQAGVQNGQIVSQVDNREKFMNTKVSNQNLLPNLNKKHQAKYYIFINELDIKKSADDVYKASEDQYQREIKVHYTILDDLGKEVSAGAIKARFPSGQNDIDKIIRIHFPLISQKIVSKIVGIPVAEVK